MFLEIVRSNNERYTKNYYVKFIKKANDFSNKNGGIIKPEQNGLIVVLQNGTLQKKRQNHKKSRCKS